MSFVKAIRKRDPALLREALKEENIDIDRYSFSDQFSETALINIASRPNENSLELAKILLENGADINCTDKIIGNTALMFAIANKQVDLALYLIEQCEIKNDKKSLDLKDTTKMCLNTPLILAIKNNLEEVALALMEAGAGVNLAEKQGLTPLHWAAIMKMDKVIEALIRKGADKTKLNDYGIPPVEYYLHTITDNDLHPGYVANKGKLVALKKPENPRSIDDFIPTCNGSNSPVPEFRDIRHHIRIDVFLTQQKIDKEIVNLLNIENCPQQLEQRIKSILDIRDEPIKKALEKGICLLPITSSSLRNNSKNPELETANNFFKELHAIIATPSDYLNNIIDELNQLSKDIQYLDIEAGENVSSIVKQFSDTNAEKLKLANNKELTDLLNKYSNKANTSSSSKTYFFSDPFEKGFQSAGSQLLTFIKRRLTP